MRLVEARDEPLARLVEYDGVLRELCSMGRASQAEELAWSTIEALSNSYTAKETLTVAGPFLRAIGESEELRAQVAELYRAAYADREGLGELIVESGIAGGRPVRRALRTLEVCLTLSAGDFLAGRDDDSAARVDEIDRSGWSFTITGPATTEILGAVVLADRYRPASPTEFQVMLRFTPDRLAEQLWKDPAQIVIDICREHHDRINSDTLATTLVPTLLNETDWKKWWTRARTGLKKCPHIKIEGRSPYELRYSDTPIALEDEFLVKFEAERQPLARLALLEKYIRDCKAQGRPLSQPALQQCYECFVEYARRSAKENTPRAGLFWVIARRIGETAGINGAADGAADLFRTSTDVPAVFREIQNEALLELACTCLAEARPEDWQEQLLALLPTFPLAVCDRAARRLVNAGSGPDDFELPVRQIMSSPFDSFEALLWLWNGPSCAEQIPAPPLITLLSRILRTLDECRRSERISKATAGTLATRARSVLASRKYERFDQCLDQLETGMARALRTQIRQLDSLGRAVGSDLLSRLSRKFPLGDSAPALQPWERDDAIYITGAAFGRKQDEIEHHVNVPMKKNAEAIGHAAERGDLSENSEYKFALEERDLLRARLAQMNAEMVMARVMTSADIQTDCVGIGTKVIFNRTTDGQRYELSFVGAWDADPNKGWLNYKAPLALKVMGKRIGDVIEFDHSGAAGSYKIVALEDALQI